MKCNIKNLISGANIMKSISQENRLHIICMLSKVESLCVCEIIKRLWIRQNLVSHHLKVLRELGIVKTKREWKNIHYAINKRKFKEFQTFIKQIFTI